MTDTKSPPSPARLRAMARRVVAAIDEPADADADGIGVRCSAPAVELLRLARRMDRRRRVDLMREVVRAIGGRQLEAVPTKAMERGRP